MSAVFSCPVLQIKRVAVLIRVIIISGELNRKLLQLAIEGHKQRCDTYKQLEVFSSLPGSFILFENNIIPCGFLSNDVILHFYEHILNVDKEIKLQT